MTTQKCVVLIVEVHVTVKHTTIFSDARKRLYGEFLSPEKQINTEAFMENARHSPPPHLIVT
jgi:hypothetical protein